MQWLVKDIFGKEGHKGVNPDEVVAVGAAIQGAQLLLGSKSRGAAGRCDAAVAGHRDAGRPADAADRAQHDASRPRRSRSSRRRRTTRPAVTISVFQGESEIAKSPSNRLLGEFNLDGIRPAPRGEPQIEVTFSLDNNGILTRDGQGPGHRQGSEDRDQGFERSGPGRGRADAQGGRGARGGGQDARSS